MGRACSMDGEKDIGGKAMRKETTRKIKMCVGEKY
jgi:hypothetical protein